MRVFQLPIFAFRLPRVALFPLSTANGGGACAGLLDNIEKRGEVGFAGVAFDHEVEFRRFAQLGFGGGHATFDFVFVVHRALPHPADGHVHARRPAD